MREIFPDKQPGDRLAAAHINLINRVCRRVGLGNQGPYIHSFSGTFETSTGEGPFFVRQLVITRAGDTAGTYEFRFRYYDYASSSWTTLENDYEFILDATESGASFAAGDKVVAYWDRQRNAFLPLTAGTGAVLKKGKTNDIVAPDETVDVTIWQDGAETEEVVEDVKHDWITNSQDIAADTEVFIGYFGEEGVWRIIGAECPSG